MTARRIARPGSVPEPGEIWVQRGPRLTLLALHLVPVARVRPFVPAALDIRAVLPGRTLATVFATEYGPGSTLEYRELIVAPAIAGVGGRHGWWVSHIYVDDERSMRGGRALGLGKELADFGWTGDRAGRITVAQGDRTLATVDYAAGGWGLPLPLGSYGVSCLGPRVLRSWQRLTAQWAPARMRVSAPPESPLHAPLGALGRPLLAIAGRRMHGEMCVDLTEIGRLDAARTDPQAGRSRRIRRW